MQNHDALSDYITKKSFSEGALLVGYTKIRRVEPVIVFGFPFTDHWFLKEPFYTTKMLGKEYSISKHVQDVSANILKSEGYTAHYKTVLSLYGDFRPLAVSAGLGEWGRNGIVVNKDHGAGLLFAAIFTNAPLPSTAKPLENVDQQHCTNCEQCINACPSKAFEDNKFHLYRCLPNCIKGCSECVKTCKAHLH